MNNSSISNKKAFFDYEIIESLEAGIILSGSEVKSIRAGKANLKGAYVALLSDGPHVIDLHISEYKNSSDKTVYNPLRKRKLLLNQKEIKSLEKVEKTTGLTVVPVKIYFKNGLIKVQISVVKGKKTYDKRESLKKSSQQMDIKRALRNF
jgi:SsrA-binding protein